MKAKVLLVTPPYHAGVVEASGTWVPLALVSVAGGLVSAGYEVEIYDAMTLFATHADIEEKIRRSRPDFVGVTSITATVNDAVAVLAAAKRVSSRIGTMLGGIHPTFMWKEILEAPGSPVDFVIRGEAETTGPELLDRVTLGLSPLNIPGVAGRDGEGRAVSGPRRPDAKDLDLLPSAWHLLDWKIYNFRPRPGSVSAIVSSSRGCAQACSFCSQQKFWRRTWRARSPESFVSELEMLNREYGVSIAMIADETPTVDRVRWRRVLDLLILRKPGVELMMETRADDIVRDRDWMADTRKAGIVHIYVGVESQSQETLDLFNKNLKVEVSREAIRLINEAGIISETAFVLGMPDETPESIRRTVKTALEYDPDMAFFMAIAPWPYADIYEDLKPYIETRDYSEYNLVKAVVKPRAMTRAEVEKELTNAFREFYMKRLEKLDQMQPAKREYMIAVTKLLASHSYLKDQMKGFADGKGMPESVRRALRQAGIIGDEPAAPAVAGKKSSCPVGRFFSR